MMDQQSHGPALQSLPTNFNHPHKPYAIQQQFMQNLYAVLDSSSIGIFESPTGTGKTLSLICGAMTWLRNNDLHDPDAGRDTSEDISTLPAWVVAQEKEQRNQKLAASYKVMKEALARARREEVRKERSGVSQLGSCVKRQIQTDFIPETYQAGGHSSNMDSSIFNSVVLELLESTGYPGMKVENMPEIPYPKGRKLFFCSRTHSQLNQLAVELRKVKFQSFEHDEEGHSEPEPPRYVALASRKNLCINSSISHLPLEELNEMCLSLQDSKVPVGKRCKFLSKESEKLDQFRDRVLASIRDIEDLAALGTDLEVCPYYAARLALPACEIISMPYPLLLNSIARESLGIDLSDSVVIIDEAHNLIDAVNGLSSASITLSQVRSCETHLETYMKNFHRKLGGTNKAYIRQLSALLVGMRSVLDSSRAHGRISLSELFRRGSDSVNINELTNYLSHSKLARKVDGYHSSMLAKESRTSAVAHSKTTPVLTLVQRFISCLANTTAEGCLLLQKADHADDLCLKYMLLDPANAFSAVVSQAHSVILAGGTMQPTEDMISLLFPLDLQRIRLFSYGHVIPKENLVAIVLSTGPTEARFNFNFENRQDPAMLRDLGTALTNFATIIPDGMVVFLASYEYLNYVLAFWRESGQLRLLEKKKEVFVETKDQTVEEILAAYCLAIDKSKGGILFAVIGGKMSEGINFSDTLGRAVFIIGLPFPNVKQPEWHARLEYFEHKHTSVHKKNGSTVQEASKLGKAAARQHYENVAMRAINQSIGRAIRHENDFATIYLVDERYCQEELKSKLPAWIKDCLAADNIRFSQTMRTTAEFFQAKRTP